MKIEGNIVDVEGRKIFPGVISVKNGMIESIVENDNFYNHFIAPGFIDAHVHIESSMLVPLEFSRLAIRKGTVGVVADPHEIANVLGKDGIYFMLENAKNASVKMFFTIPSCVPATPLDCSGGEILSNDVEDLFDTGLFVGLSEMMNVPGVLMGDVDVCRKIESARKRNLVIDGHAPGLKNEDLIKYIAAGISTDHECTTEEEALEKIAGGMKILIREGSAAKNYEALKGLIKKYPNEVMFCTDDSHPDDLIEFGHIDKIVKRAVADGFDLFDVLKAASLNAIRHYHLNIGTLKIGEKADFTVFENLKDFTVSSVYIDGIKRYDKNMGESDSSVESFKEVGFNKFLRKAIEKNEIVKKVSNHILCIDVKDGEIVTGKIDFQIAIHPFNLESDLERDILKIVYINRYKNDKPQVAYIHGVGLKRGAFATSISHDSHNLIAVGCSDAEIVAAVNAVIDKKGGLVIVDGDNIEVMALPIAGIMSDQRGEKVADRWNEFCRCLNDMGCLLNSPFMTLSFMALIVIPELKIGEKGLFEYSSFGFIS